MKDITLEELLEAGCHFGHQVTRGNPKARDYIYEARDNIHIIDLVKTKKGLEDAAAFIRDLASKNGSLIIIGTKRQAQAVVKDEVKRAIQQIGESENGGLFYVINRWVGGTLTNFSEVCKNFKKLEELSKKLENEEEKAKYTKKEAGLWLKEKQKLESLYGGIADLKQKPDALFIIDSHLEDLVVREAKAVGVATVAIVDTNADPSVIDHPIPANDDAVGSIKLITNYIINAWIEGAGERKRRSSPASEAKTGVEKNLKSKAEKENKKTATTDAQKKSKSQKKIEKKSGNKK